MDHNLTTIAKQVKIVFFTKLPFKNMLFQMTCMFNMHQGHDNHAMCLTVTRSSRNIHIIRIFEHVVRPIYIEHAKTCRDLHGQSKVKPGQDFKL